MGIRRFRFLEDTLMNLNMSGRYLNIIFLFVTIIGGIIFGFITKGLLHLLRVSVSNWLIFLTSIVLVGFLLGIIAISFQ